MMCDTLHRLRRLAPGSCGRPRAFWSGNRQSAIANRKSRSAFTLVEILVAVAIMVVLGAALIGLMSSGVEAWRRGEADRQVHEKLQAVRRQIADDLAAAVVDPPPVPDFHYALDTLWDLPAPGDPYYIIESGAGNLRTDPAAGTEARYFAPGTAEVVLKIRVPFTIGAALLKARMDCFDAEASVVLEVARNNPTAADPADREVPIGWTQIEALVGEGIGGAERDITHRADGTTPLVQGGDIVFVRATMTNGASETAQFLRGDRLRSEGRPVLILDCYKDAQALSSRARPTFLAWYEDGAQVVSWVRTIPGEMEKATLRQEALGGRARVVYRVERYAPEANKPGLGILRRGYQVPLDDSVAVRDIPTHDFIPHVLHFGLSFWGGDTTVWETRPELEPDYDTKYDDADTSKPPVPHPPSQRWLSSRYLPEQVQVSLVVEPDRGQHFSAGLLGGIDASFATVDSEKLRLSSTRGFPSSNHARDFVHDFIRDPRHFVKIDDEWLYYERADKRTNALVIPDWGRGMRGTTPAAHSRGRDVWRGRAFVFTVHVPAFRHWQR